MTDWFDGYLQSYSWYRHALSWILDQPDVIVFIRIEASGGELEESIYSKMETKMCLLVVFLVNGKCWKYHFRTLKITLDEGSFFEIIVFTLEITKAIKVMSLERN